MPLPVFKNTNSNPAAATTPKVTVWTGDAGTSYTAAGNYTNGAPADGSSVYVVGSSVNITSNVNQPSTSLKEFRVGKSYSGSIGTATTPLKIMAERLVIDNTRAEINIRGSFRDIHIINASSRVKVGGSQTRKLDRLMYHGASSNFDMYDGQCNRLILGPGQTQVTAPSGVTNDNLLAQVSGFDEIRCGKGSKVVTSAGVNDLNATGNVEVSGTGNVFNARLLEGSKLTTKTTGRIDGKLTMFGGVLDVRNPSSGDSFVIDNADLFGGRLFTLLSEQDLVFTSNAKVLGPAVFALKSGSTIAVS